jgi:hypothetical protein
MNEGKASGVLEPVGNGEVLKFGVVESARSILGQIVRNGARKMLQAALEDGVNAFLELNSTKVDCDDRRLVVRNGYMPFRELVTVHWDSGLPFERSS